MGLLQITIQLDDSQAFMSNDTFYLSYKSDKRGAVKAFSDLINSREYANFYATLEKNKEKYTLELRSDSDEVIIIDDLAIQHISEFESAGSPAYLGFWIYEHLNEDKTKTIGEFKLKISTPILSINIFESSDAGFREEGQE
ncbi:hypothetical protein ACFQZI_13235 [Mucilaginibacter lutimaris]|uniref:Uncharacterized protein n=1 Tax=Mucilaginibacter lutimaris TaxID=931629 RepID=A0ABW2ZHX1_9SPHI